MKNLFVAMASCLLVLSACSNPSSSSCASKCESEEACCTSGKDSLLYVMNIKAKIKPECVSAYKEAFAACKEETDKEPGALDYNLYQSTTDSTAFLIAETWQNKLEHLKHMETEHLKTYLELVKDMGEGGSQMDIMDIYVCPKVNKK